MEIEYLLLIFMPVMVTAGQVLLKKNSHLVTADRGIAAFLLSLLNPGIIAAGACIAAAPLLYIRALGAVPLSEAFAFNSLNYIIVFFAGRFILDEKLNIYRIIGVVLITAGFLLPFVAEAAGA
ncbi:MAG TPA: hypothetical protein DCO79_06195 [Spirochaeta sp.]|nr:hypothetical protein [Spirochaeta sp.]